MTKLRKSGGPPSFCWYCMKQLQRAGGVGKGLFYYAVVEDAGGQHRVHGDCVERAVADGAKEVK